MILKTLMPDLHTLIPYDYKFIQNDAYEEILRREVDNAQSVSTPVFYQVSGMPGSGKSAYCTHFLQKNTSYAYVSFDKIMEQLPAYHQDIQEKGTVEAFKKWEIPARVIGYELLKRLIEKGSDILLEHSGVNDVHLNLCKNIKQMNYKTKVCFLLCDEAVAQERAKRREEQIQRHTPPELIHQRAVLMREYIIKYYQIADDIRLLDASDKVFQPIELKI